MHAPRACWAAPRWASHLLSISLCSCKWFSFLFASGANANVCLAPLGPLCQPCRSEAHPAYLLLETLHTSLPPERERVRPCCLFLPLPR